MDKPKKTIFILVAVVLLIGLVIGGYFGWKKWRESKALAPETSALEKAGETAEKITESATQGVLPSIGTNPLESKPDVNPADKANPFKDIKTNPFE